MNNKSELKLAESLKVHVELKNIQVCNYKVNYIEAGKGKPLIFIHGANIGWGQWYKNIPELASQYKVYALDLPGSAGSSKLDFRTSAIADIFNTTVSTFIETLSLKNVCLIGHSIGAWICIKIARNKSIEKIVLVNPLGFSKNVPPLYKPSSIFPLALFISKTFMKPTRENMKIFLSSAFLDKTKLEDIFVDYYYESVHRDSISHPLLLMNKIAGFSHVKDEFMLVDELDQVKKPVLVIVGDKDALTPIKAIKNTIQQYPNFQLQIISETSHVPPLEKPQVFNEMVINFVN